MPDRKKTEKEARRLAEWYDGDEALLNKALFSEYGFDLTSIKTQSNGEELPSVEAIIMRKRTASLQRNDENRESDEDSDSDEECVRREPTAKHVAILREKPDFAGKFDDVYGKGAAARILGELQSSSKTASEKTKISVKSAGGRKTSATKQKKKFTSFGTKSQLQKKEVEKGAEPESMSLGDFLGDIAPTETSASAGGDPFQSTGGDGFDDLFNAGAGDPFAAGGGDAFSMGGGDPFATGAIDPFRSGGDHFGGGDSDPFRGSGSDPFYGVCSQDPFAMQGENPFPTTSTMSAGFTQDRAPLPPGSLQSENPVVELSAEAKMLANFTISQKAQPPPSYGVQGSYGGPVLSFGGHSPKSAQPRSMAAQVARSKAAGARMQGGM